MGSFYTSLTIRGAAREEVAKALKGRKAAISPTIDQYTVVWDSECENQDEAILEKLSARLSSELKSPVLAALNHDDDILMYWLFKDGKKIDEYNSAPGYFDGGDDAPRGGNAVLLADIMSTKSAAKAAEDVLRNEEYVFASERHHELLNSLAMPIAGTIGFRYIEKGEAPEGVGADEILFVQ